MDSIFHRISVRKYADKSVEKEKIMQILRAVLQEDRFHPERIHFIKD